MTSNTLVTFFRRARGSRRARRFAGWSLVAALALAEAAAFHGAVSRADGPAIASIFYSGEQRGHLEPCGCSKPQVGGLPRRATYLKRVPAEVAHLQIENGDLVEEPGRQSQLKADALAEFFKLTHYTAVNVGEEDYTLGFGYLRYLQSLSGVSLLSGNVVRSDDKPVFDTHVLATLKVGGKEVPVAIIGLISPKFQETIAQWNPGFTVQPPAKTLEALKPQIQEKAKLVVLLFHGGLDEAKELVKAAPWLDAIVTAHEAEDFRARAERVEEYKTLIVNTGQKGKSLGELDVRLGEDGTPHLEHRFPIEMSHELPDDPDTRAIMDRYLSHVGEEGLLSQVPKRKSPNGQPFAGSAACATCHEDAHKIWAESGHSHAWKTLVEARHDKDPDCVGCHTVGFEFEGGFKSPTETPKLKNVGCENCHGPLGSHAKDPTKFTPAKIGTTVCATCHTPDQSPSFDQESFWKKIKH